MARWHERTKPSSRRSFCQETFVPSPSAFPVLLTADRLHRERGGSVILDDVSVTVGPDARIGVVGPNGVGKTTLLRILAGLERADRGRVDIAPPEATVGYLTQEPDRDSTSTEIVDAYLRRRTGVTSAQAELVAAADTLASLDPGAEARYGDSLERWVALGAGNIDARIETVMRELGLPLRVLSVPTAALSGGQAARLSLATILLSRCDVFFSTSRPTILTSRDWSVSRCSYSPGRAG